MHFSLLMRRMILSVLAMGVIVGLVVSTVNAGGAGGIKSGPGAGAPKPPPAEDPNEPRITVTWATGQAQPAFFISADPDGVKLRIAMGKEAQVYPWEKIKRLSNGVTREKVVADWKTQHASELCDTCHGDRVSPCESCKGTGVKSDEQKPCDKCEGKGTTGDCKKCKTTGAIECPDNCLKLSQGNWVKKEDGVRWRSFKNKDGGMPTWSEHHLGEIVVNEAGVWVNKGKCPTCNGTMKIKCPGCDGKGQALCKSCKGKGVVGPACSDCKEGMAPCKPCGGTGLKAPSTQPTGDTPGNAGDAGAAGATISSPPAPPAEAPPAP
jgi:hypothetical protein